MYRNPIIPGCHPDPSICRVGDDYYLVTSSFGWAPGVPIFHSRDLVNWRQLGHVLHDLDLDALHPTKDGIYAPTIRHHDGVFYMITTLMPSAGNFLVTATDPGGPWSDPVWFPEAIGFDPSLLFDDDGRVWMCGSRERAAKTYDGDTEIWLRELDLRAMKLIGEEHVIWEPLHRGGIWTEGPHIYRHDGLYYLLTSEGGTAEDHAVMIARSPSITGPYVPNPRDPVLTHRHLGLNHPITSTGHADLVQTPAGDWWAVLLATRPYGGPFTSAAGLTANLGRETFLTSVHWEEGWPVFAQVQPEMAAPALPASPWPPVPACDHFDSPALDPVWQWLPGARWSAGGGLNLDGVLARPQAHADFAALTCLASGQGGLGLIQNATDRITLTRAAGELTLRHRDTVVATVPVPDGRVWLGVDALGQDYQFRYAHTPGDWQPIGPPQDGRLLSSIVSGGFVGAMIALLGEEAHFDWFEYAQR